MTLSSTPIVGFALDGVLCPSLPSLPDEKLFWYNRPSLDSEGLSQIGLLSEVGLILPVFLGKRNDMPGDDPNADYQTLLWLHRHQIIVIKAVDTSEASGIGLAVILGVQYFLTDRIEDVSGMRRMGIEAFLLTQPQNQKDGTSYRVASIAEFLEIVQSSHSDPRPENSLGVAA